MSVTSVTIKDHSMTISIDGNVPVRSYAVVYQVECNDQLDGPLTVTSHASMPVFGSTYAVGNDADPYATFKGYSNIVRVNPESQLPIWLASATFDTRTSDVEPGSPNIETSPLQVPPKWSGSFSNASKLTDIWDDGTAIENSSGESMNIEIDDGRPSIIVQFPVETIDLPSLCEYHNAVNNATWWGFDAHTLKIASITWESAIWNGVVYFTLTVEVHIKLDEWSENFIDEGYSELIGDVRASILDDTTKMPVRERRYLDGTGRKLPEGNPIVMYPQPKKLPYSAVDFSGIGMPTTLFGNS